MIKVQRYESMDEPDHWVAVFSDGRRVKVCCSRDRMFPGLTSAAPWTGGVYRIAQHALGRHRALLDIGCGSAAGARSLVGPGRGVTGIDPSPEAIAFARTYAPSVGLIEGTIDQLEPTDRFDAATLIDVLGFIDSPLALLRDARTHLSKSAVLVVGEPRASLEQPLAAPARRAATGESLEALLIRAGYIPEAVAASPAEFVLYTASLAPDLRVADALTLCDSRSLDTKRAIEVVTAALECVANQTEARELLLSFGTLHLRSGDFDSAAGTFVGALRLAPRSARGLVGLGRVAEGVGRPAEALRLYEKAARSSPLEPQGWLALGLLHERLGHADLAAAALAKASHLAPVAPTP